MGERRLAADSHTFKDSRLGIRCALRPEEIREPRYLYLVAGFWLAADEPLDSLAPCAPPPDFPPIQPVTLRLGEARLVHQGPGWIANAWRAVSAWWNAAGCRLHIEDVGEFWVAADGHAFAVLRRADAADRSAIEEALLGPSLILTLALNGVWCLHASAVSRNGAVIAIAGESGQGKSTLAAFLDADPGARWRRIADDILPVRLSPRGPVALPRFPQLKLPAPAQYPADAGEHLPLEAILTLDPQDSDAPDPITVSPLPGGALTQALIRHTVASRLFSPELLRAHLAFCATLAHRSQGHRLCYPKRLTVLPELREAIAACTGANARRP